jgi:hypothetical protein
MIMNVQPKADAPPVMFLPGAILPAQISYGPLLKLLGTNIQAIVKDLEVNSPTSPPPHYRLEMEVKAMLAAADKASAE